MIAELQSGLGAADREFLDTHVQACGSCRELSSELYRDHSVLNRWGLGDLRLARASVSQRQSLPRVIARILGFSALVLVVLGLGVATLGTLIFDHFTYSYAGALAAQPLAIPAAAPAVPVGKDKKVSPAKPKTKLRHDFVAMVESIIVREASQILDLQRLHLAELARAQAKFELLHIFKPQPPAPKKANVPPAQRAKRTPERVRPKPSVDLNPAVYFPTPERPVGPRELPIKLLAAVQKLGVDPGLLYDKLSIFPVVNHTVGRRKQLARSRISKATVSECTGFQPNRLVISEAGPFSSWSVFPGLIIEASGGLRVTSAFVDVQDEPQYLPVFPLGDAALMLARSEDFRREVYDDKVMLTPAVVPSRVRAEIAAGQDLGRIRRVAWNAMSPPGDELHSRFHFVPRTDPPVQAIRSRYFRNKRVVEDEMRQLSHLIKVEFAKIDGFRGVALSIAARPVSIDVFEDKSTALAAIESLLLGLAMEAYEENNFIPTYTVSRNILKGQYLTLDYHKLAYGKARELMGLHGSTWFRKSFVDKRMAVELALESYDDQTIKHFCVVFRH